jgi:hypothetical protein
MSSRSLETPMELQPMYLSLLFDVNDFIFVVGIVQEIKYRQPAIRSF